MLTENIHYRLTHKIIDESFELQKLPGYCLYLTFGRHNVRFGVLDLERNKFISMEDYEVSNVFTPMQAAQAFSDAFSQHPYLFSPDWRQVKVAVKNHSFTLIPETLFKAAAAADYLRLNCDFDPDEEQLFTYRHPNSEAVNIFAADKHFVNVWQKHLPHKPVQFLHLTSALITGLLHQGHRSDQRKLFAYIEQKSLCLVVTREGVLEFCNLFPCNAPEDFLYFLILVIQEQKLNPDEDPVTIWGEITHDSALFSLIRKYIRHVQFGTRLNGSDYSYKLEDVFGHLYLDIYSLHFCD